MARRKLERGWLRRLQEQKRRVDDEARAEALVRVVEAEKAS